GDPLDPDEVRAEPLEPDEKPIERQRGEEEGNGESEGIGGEQHRAVRNAPLGGGERENGAQDGTDTGCPRGTEGDSDEPGPKVTERLVGKLEPKLPREKGGLDDPQEVQPEEDDDDAPDSADPDLPMQEQHAEDRGARAQADEDGGEAGHERKRVEQRRSAPDFQLVSGEPREEPDVARDERQDAGGEKAQQSGEKGDGKRGRHPQKQTAETTVVQRPSSPHSAVEVMFIVRTISPDKSHCSRRSSQALSVSNGPPSTVASIDAARSSAYSPDVISFCP